MHGLNRSPGITLKSFNRSAITILSTEEFLEWVKQVRPELHRWNLDALNQHPNVYLVDVEDHNRWGDCFEKHYKGIFNNEVGEYVRLGESWPEVTMEIYSKRTGSE
jgi:hypothetical protein